jgi:hypothetical protein
MLRRAAFGLATAVLVVGASGTAAVSQSTSLRVTYWEDSAKPHSSVTWALRCGPPHGSHFRPVVACRRLAAGGPTLFAPLPKEIVCTQIYGGPQRARVVGLLAGKRIWATFTRTNGCEIGRWQRISPWLVPPGGVT